jgi:uncharacterized protein DUF5691
MRSWKELTTQALQGTATATDGAEAERRLLNEAGWHVLRRLAGRKSIQIQLGVVSEAPPESLPCVSARAARRLEEILRTDDHDHLEEWLLLCAAVKKLVPPSLLPPLLERATGRANLRQSVLEVGGKRVQWLAGRNEEWSYAAIADPVEAFRSGSRPARVAALAEMRRQDPAGALTALTDGWAKEGGDDRVALIAVLSVGLGPNDEDFLTRSAADSRKEVRTSAADLLAQLPGSGLITRMTVRANAWIRYRKGLLGGKLEVTPPTECDGGMIADGIEAKAPKSVGERAHWLRQVLAFVPPSHWPAEVLELGAKSDWAEPLLLGWIDAATRFHDAEWCERLIEYHLRRSDRDKTLLGLQDLGRATPPAIFEAVLNRHLPREPLTSFTLAAMTTHQFTIAASAALLRAFEGVFKQRDQRLQQRCLRVFARELSSRLDPAILPGVVAFSELAAQPAPWVPEQLQSLASNLEYRAEMAKEIRS